MTCRRWLWVIMTIGMAGACGGEDQRTDTVTPDVVREARESLPQGLVAQLDSGNAAIRNRDPAAALAHYRRATEIDPASAAGWFGVYMAAAALGDEGAAEDALERARSLAPRASLLEGDTATIPDPP